jgi:hypothetical protein
LRGVDEVYDVYDAVEPEETVVEDLSDSISGLAINSRQME